VKIGGPFTPSPNPTYLAPRIAVYEEVMAAQRERLAKKPRVPIRITLPDGNVKEGISWQTTPMEVSEAARAADAASPLRYGLAHASATRALAQLPHVTPSPRSAAPRARPQIAEGISKGLAGSAVVAKVTYTNRVGVEEADGLGVVNTGPEEEDEAAAPGAATPAAKPELWDLTRPLEGDCLLELKKFDDKDGRMVFWHSSAHVLGECLECQYGAHLCIGPPTEEGFYYDAYMGGQ
jgi:threonyl-tRNA synthetase